MATSAEGHVAGSLSNQVKTVSILSANIHGSPTSNVQSEYSAAGKVIWSNDGADMPGGNIYSRHRESFTVHWLL